MAEMTEVRRAKGYDQSCKYLSDHDPADFLALVGAITLDEPVEIERIERELVTPARAVDQLFCLRTTAGTRLAHLEVNTRWRDNLPARVADYAVRIWLPLQEPMC
jgi:hypothetical protein